jgi:hypothetical protein
MASWLMRIVLSSGKSIGKRRAICSGLQALAALIHEGSDFGVDLSAA